MVIINCKCELHSFVPVQLEIPVAEGTSFFLSFLYSNKRYSNGYLRECSGVFGIEAKALLDKQNIKAVIFKYPFEKNHWYIYVPELKETTTWIGEPTVENVIRFIEGFKCLYR